MNESPEFLFAKKVIQKLTESGFQALLAGGCVRDYLLGRTPKDYDVATNATPAQVQQVFGLKKTIAIGAAFGVITVIGSRKTGNIEIATFRQDGNYTDGRRPESVTYCNAKEDALRRDFTINGLFYDTQTNEVVDYVQGQKDLEKQTIRAIGVPADRFGEDRLRMLRAVRFATTLQFQLEEETLASIQDFAPKIIDISDERISTEMEKLLSSENRAFGLQLLCDSKLAPFVFSQWWGDGVDESDLEKDIELIRPFLTDSRPILPVVLSVLFWQRFQRENQDRLELFHQQIDQAKKIPLDLGAYPTQHSESIQKMTEIVSPLADSISLQSKQWKLSNEYQKVMTESLRSLPVLCLANRIPWSILQPVIVSKFIEPALEFAKFVLNAINKDSGQIDICREKIKLPEEQKNPTVLIDGRKLQQLGIQHGPDIGQIMSFLRQKQLDEPGFDVDRAEEWVKKKVASQSN